MKIEERLAPGIPHWSDQLLALPTDYSRCFQRPPATSTSTLVWVLGPGGNRSPSLTQFPTVRGFSGEGLILDHPLTRADFRSFG